MGSDLAAMGLDVSGKGSRQQYHWQGGLDSL